MNKIYKLVYSKALNSLVAVSEIATQASASTSSKVTVDEKEMLYGDSKKANFNKLALTFVLSSLFAGLPLAASASTGNGVERKVIGGEVATATVDNSNDQNTHLNYKSVAGYSAENAGIVANANGPKVDYVNGVPVVNIVDSKNGVSDNRFSKFSTDTGVIFNNIQSGTVAVESKILRQKINANENLREAARTILAQVTGNDKSVISGAMEVLGQKADLLLINPNGIDLNGVELVNTREFTASTAEVNDNNYRSLNVQKGEVNVNNSLTSEDVEVIRLVAKAVKIKASIAPKNNTSKKANIYVAGGKQNYDLQTNTATQTEKNPTAEKTVAISGSALGSMYGNKVNFIVTESGAGVQYDGIIIGDDDLQITADGDVELKNTTYAKGTNTIESKRGNVVFKTGQDESHNAIHGDAKSSNKVIIKAAQQVDTRVGTLHANKAVEVSADSALLGNVQADHVKVAAQRFVKTEVNTKLKANVLDIDANQIAAFGGNVIANETFNFNVNSNDNAKQIAQVRFNDEVSIATANIYANNVAFEGQSAAERVGEDVQKSLFRIETLNLNLVSPIALNSKAPLSVINGNLVSKDLNLDLVNGSNLNSKLVDVERNGEINVKNDANVNLVKHEYDGNIISDNQLYNLSSLVNSIKSASTNVKLNTISIAEKQNLSFNNKAKLIVNKFDNKGLVDTNSSLTIESEKEFNNDGLMFVKGNLNIASKKSISLGGNVWAYANMNMKAPIVYQTSQVNVGGDMEVVSNLYNLWSKNEGRAKLTSRHKWSNTVNWHYHALRKDRYELGAWLARLDTSEIKFDTVETSVLGNFKLRGYNEIDPKAKSHFKMENGRLYVGGNATIYGDLTVRTDTFKVPLKDFLSFENGFLFKFKPVTLINSDLCDYTTTVFLSLADMFDKVLINENGQHDYLFRNVMGYGIEGDQIMNTLKQMNLDPIYNRMLSSVFGTNWKALSADQMRDKWKYFRQNEDKFNINLFAPNSEVMTMGEFHQENGKVFIGADNIGRDVSTVNRAKKGLGTEILVENSEDLAINEKLSGIKTYENLLEQFNSQIELKDGKYVGTRVASWLKGADILSTAKDKNVNADNNALALVVYEQYKDIVGGYGSAGRDPKVVLDKLVASTKAAQKVRSSLQKSDRGTYFANIEGKSYEFISKSDFEYFVDSNYDEIKWDRENEVDVPKLNLSIATLSKTTNFNEVAGSVSSSTSIDMRNVESLNVVSGSINSKRVALDVRGDVNLQSHNNQNSINSEETTINTLGDFNSTGNLRLGDTTIQALGDVNFNSLAFFTEKGYLGHQAEVVTNDANIVAGRDSNFKGASLRADGDVNLQANNINLEAVHDEASDFKSINAETEMSGRQITQEGQFVHGSGISGDNVNIVAEDKLTIESSKVVAKEEANITAAELETKAKANQKEIYGIEEKNTSTLAVKANFGSAEAGAAMRLTDNRDVNGQLDDKYATWANAAADTQKAGEGTVSGSVTFKKETNKIRTYDATHVNTELNAQNLNINVEGEAELGNTNINTNGEGVSADDLEKTATIKAGSVKQTNAKDLTTGNTHHNSWAVSLEAYGSSALVTTASHITSAARTSALGTKVDPTFAATVVGDITSIITKDAITAGVKASISHKTSSASAVSVSDSRNNIAGSVNIETTGDTLLKAIDGTLKDLNVKAKNFTVEGGTTETNKTFSSNSFSLSADISGGAGFAGGSGSVTASVSASTNKTETESLKHNNSNLLANNVNINVKEDVNLKSANINASGDVNVEANRVNIASELDVEKTIGSGNGWSLSGGTSLGTKIVPFGSGGAFFEKHSGDKQIVGTISGISGKNTNIKAEELNLVSAVINSKETGNVDVERINVADLDVHENNDGFKVGTTVGFNAGGAIIGSVTGGRDARVDYAAKIKSTISENIKIADKAVINNETGEGINRDTNKVIDVVRDDKYQDTSFDLTGSTTVIRDIKKTFSKLSVQASNAREALANYFGKSMKDAAAGSGDYAGNNNLASASYSTHYMSYTPDCTTCNSYSASSNPYATNYNTGGTSALGYAKGTNNPYASYGGGRYTDGVLNSNSLDVSSLSADNNLVNQVFGSNTSSSGQGSKNPTASISNSQLAYGTLSSAERNAGGSAIRRVASDKNFNEGVLTGRIRDVTFSDVLSSASRDDSNNRDFDFDFVGSDSSVFTNDQDFDFSGVDNTPVNTGSLDDGGIFNNEVHKEISTIDREINKEISNHFNNGMSSGASNSTAGNGTGTASNASSNGGTGNGTNYGNGSGSGNSEVLTGSNGNSGSNGSNSTSSTVTNTNSDFDLDFTGSDNNSGSSKPSTGASGNGGAGSTGGSTVTEDSSNSTVINNGTASKESGNVVASGDKENVGSSESSTSISSSEASNTSSTSSTSSSTSTTKEEKASDKVATSESNTSDNDILSVANKEATKETSKVDYTPADGNAKVGETIDMSSNSKVTKYQVGNLSCYVMNSNKAAQAKLKAGDTEGFEKFIQNTAKSRATLFSKYSDGFESALGDGGVICVPNSSEVMRTDYNVYQAKGDIPIIKTDEDTLDAVVVTERKVVKVKVVSNGSAEAKKVVYQPANVKVREVAKIKETLASKGIDSNKIMILGIKDGASHSVAKALENKAKGN